MRRESNDFDVISEIPVEPKFPVASTSANSTNVTSESRSFVTIPPKPSSENVVPPGGDSNPEMTCLTCCCLYGRDETFTTPVQVAEKNQYCHAVAKTLRKFLSTVAFYCFVLLLTFLLSILLLAELLISLDIIVVPGSQQLDNESALTSQQFNFESRQTHVLYALHWTNFSLLSLCFFEILLRFFAWKLDLVKSAAAVCDCAAVTVSFVVNLVTTIAAGFDSPFNAISLIIVFRFIRIKSLIEVSTRRVKTVYQEKLAQSESNAAVLQVANQKLNRQISEKDYEIKQLQGHLGNLDGESGQELLKELEQKRDNHSRYEDELEKALALSKRAYEEENGGFSNPSYINHNQEEEERMKMSEVTVHHREDSIRRNPADIPSTSKLLPTSSGDTCDPSLQEKPEYEISHGDLHAGNDSAGHNTSADTTLLLDGKESKPEPGHWTVGYCIVESHHQDVISTKKQDLFLKKEKSKVATDQEDEGIGEESNSPLKHSRNLSGDHHHRTDDMLSDQGCVCTTSLCSESGYQSEERLFSHPPANNVTPPVEEDVNTASRSDTHHPPVIAPGIALNELGDSKTQSNKKEDSEDEL